MYRGMGYTFSINMSFDAHDFVRLDVYVACRFTAADNNPLFNVS